MLKYLSFLISCILAVAFAQGQPGAQQQYNSYQRQHEQTVKAYSSGAASATPAPVYKSSSPSSSSSSNSSSGGYSGGSTRTYGSSTNSTRPSSAAATDDDDEDYKPLTQAELDEMKRVRAEKARAAAESASYSTSEEPAATTSTYYKSSSPAEILRPTLLVMYDGTSGTYLEQKLPNGNTWQGLYVNDKPSNGRLKFKNGLVFLGNFNKDGRRERGIQTYPDGSVYEGTFYPDGNLARGVFKFPNAAVFTGEFKNSMLYRGEYSLSGEDTKRGEFYPNGQLKVGKFRNSFGFYDEKGQRNGYTIRMGMRDPGKRPDETISSTSGGPTAVHMYDREGIEMIDFKGKGMYKQIGVRRKGSTGQTKYFAITQDDKAVWLTDADKQLAIDAEATALAMIAKGRAEYTEAVKWDPALLPPTIKQ